MDSEHKVKHIVGKSTATDPVVGLLLHMLEEKKAVGMLYFLPFQGSRTNPASQISNDALKLARSPRF